MSIVLTRKQPKTRARRDKEAKARKQKGLKVKFVPAEIIRKHLHQLHDQGWSYTSIAQQAGVGHATVYRIAAGERDNVHPRTANALMNVSPRRPNELLDDTRMVSAIGVRRRLQALLRQGHRREEIAEAAGITLSVIRHALRDDSPSLTRAARDSICAAYDVMSTRSGTSKITASRAEAKGWPSPWDWEAANIDDPLSYPPKVSGPSRGDLKRRAAALDGPHVTAEDLAKKLGVTSRTIVRWRTERRNQSEVLG